MKVWELIHELSRAPANCEVLLSKGEKSWKIDSVNFQDYNFEGFSDQLPVNINIGQEDK